MVREATSTQTGSRWPRWLTVPVLCRWCTHTVEGGHRAILFNRLQGVMPTIYPEGTHFRIPLLEWPIDYDVRSKPLVINSTTGSRGTLCPSFPRAACFVM